jgi:hypothetical protein
MYRTNMATGVSTETLMATASTTGAGIPGNTRISATTINVPAIDNDNFAYFVQCTTGSNDSTTGVIGANLTYSITGGQGAAGLRMAPASKGGSTKSSTAK